MTYILLSSDLRHRERVVGFLKHRMQYKVLPPLGGSVVKTRGPESRNWQRATLVSLFAFF